MLNDERMNFDKFLLLKRKKKYISKEKAKFLKEYFIGGKEIPYPLYKDREKVMNPK